MSRIRTIKPDLARHEALFQLEQETGLPIRFAWAMLPTVCDREGRFKWRPNVLKLDILPFDDCDFSRVLDAWATRGQVVKYRVGDAWFGLIPTWAKHQVVNNKEKPSDIPPLDNADEVYSPNNQAVANACATRAPRVNDALPELLGKDQGEGKGREGEKEGKGKEKDAPEPGGSGRATPIPIPLNWTPNEVNTKWLTESGLSASERDGVVAEFVRWASNSGLRKANWDLAFSRNPAVKSAAGRAKGRKPKMADDYSAKTYEGSALPEWAEEAQ